MKFVSTLAAAVVGGFLFAGGAQAAPVTSSGALADIAASTLADQVACRTVTKRVCSRGRCRTTRRRICTGPRYDHRACRTVTRKSCVGRRCRTVTRRTCR